MADVDCSRPVRGRGPAPPRPAAIRRHCALLSLACRASGVRSARTVTGPRLLAVDRTSVTRAGSPVPLVRNLLVFGVQYGIAVAVFRQPEAHVSLTLAKHVVSGASVGYFIGWTIAFRRRYQARRDAARSALEAGRPAIVARKS